MDHRYNIRENDVAVEPGSFMSVTQNSARGDVSEKYAFIPTFKVLNVLEKEGWKPANIREARVLDADNNGFQKHIVRLRNPNVKINNKDNLFPEIILTNSHNGSSSFQIMAGIFRQVCLNGLCVADSMLETARIRHQGYTDEKVSEAIFRVTSSLPAISSRVEEFQSIKLSLEERQAFAESVLDLAFDDSAWLKSENRPLASKSNTAKILSASRRQADSEDNLWNVFNRCQERILKGGMTLVSEDGRYRIGNKSKAVKSIDRDIKLNKALWTLTEHMAALKG